VIEVEPDQLDMPGLRRTENIAGAAQIEVANTDCETGSGSF
jgi:hypothetical protein